MIGTGGCGYGLSVRILCIGFAGEFRGFVVFRWIFPDGVCCESLWWSKVLRDYALSSLVCKSRRPPRQRRRGVP